MLRGVQNEDLRRQAATLTDFADLALTPILVESEPEAMWKTSGHLTTITSTNPNAHTRRFPSLLSVDAVDEKKAISCPELPSFFSDKATATMASFGGVISESEDDEKSKDDEGSENEVENEGSMQDCVYPEWDGLVRVSELSLLAPGVNPKVLFEEVEGILHEDMPAEMRHACKVAGVIEADIFVDFNLVRVEARVLHNFSENVVSSALVLRRVAGHDVVHFHQMARELAQHVRCRGIAITPSSKSLIGDSFDDDEFADEAWPDSMDVEQQDKVLKPLIEGLCSRCEQYAIEASTALARIASQAPTSWKIAVAMSLVVEQVAVSQVLGAPRGPLQLALQYPLAAAINSLSKPLVGITETMLRPLQLMVIEQMLYSPNMPDLVRSTLSSAVDSLSSRT
mmetsp:Transcript_70916/g.179498  ORF Transcript_70916/g.179498 Transcript_70916/m.179498 type:complete len:397 (-) Transcript_70916:275-1465(-)